MKSYSKNIFIPQSRQQLQEYHHLNRFNSNVFSIDFEILKNKSKIAMGDPIFCQKCKASIASTSQVDNIKETNWKWVCEFCSFENILENIEEEEIPKEEDLCYVIQSNAQNNDQKQDLNSDLSIVFVIDQSGSMNVTQELKNKNELNIDNETLKELENFKQFMEPQEYQQYKQMLLSQNAQKYISRKDCVVAAIKDQLIDLKNTYPQRKVGLVTFNDDVVVIGDGVSEQCQVIAGDKLHNYEAVLQESKQFNATNLKVPIQQSAEQLTKQFENIKPSGKTALGPALVTALGLIGECKPGSQIILCTDGLANIGFGSLDTDEEAMQSEEIYKKISDYAVEKGVKISIITVKGEQANVKILGQITQSTQGSITRVNPENIHNDFASILKQQVIATKTELKVWLHEGLEFKNYEQEENSKLEDKKLLKNIGNVTEKTTVSFEYDLKKMEDLKKLEIDLEKIKKLPFQVQITYLSEEGHSMMRILSKQQDIVDNEREVHTFADVNVIQGHQNNLNRQNVLFGNFSQVQQQQQSYNTFLNNNLSNNYYDSTEQIQSVQQNFQKEQKVQQLMKRKQAKCAPKKPQQQQQSQQQWKYQQPQMMMQQQQQQQQFLPPPPMQPQQSQNANLFGGSMIPPPPPQINSMIPPPPPGLNQNNINNNNNNNNSLFGMAPPPPPQSPFQQQQQQQQMQPPQYGGFSQQQPQQLNMSMEEQNNEDEDEDDVDCDIYNFQ